MTALADLTERLVPQGLRVLGDCPDGGHTISLIGPDEPAFWSIFAGSAEYADGQPNPMDRWSTRVIGGVATDLGAEALFPFGGPPYQPFYSWAVRSGRFSPSPIGFLVHDERGLFASFRGAIRHRGIAETATKMDTCITCTQPCAGACPVGAFDEGYDVDACRTHLLTPAGAACRTGGCLARRACPIGQNLRHPAQAAFHMEAFI